MRRISRVAENRSASQEALCSIALCLCLTRNDRKYWSYYVRLKLLEVSSLEICDKKADNTHLPGYVKANLYWISLEDKLQTHNKINGAIRRHFRKQMNEETKLRIHNVTSKAALKFGNETWVLKKKERNNV